VAPANDGFVAVAFLECGDQKVLGIEKASRQDCLFELSQRNVRHHTGKFVVLSKNC
jgi:hypothetical protein